MNSVSQTKSDEPITRVEVNTAMPTEVHLQGYAALSFLYFHSPNLGSISVHEMSMRIMPAIALGAFHIFYENNMPRAAVTWAMLGDETVEKLTSGVQLAPSEWVSGDQLWVMESIAPFKGTSAEIVSKWVVDVLAKNTNEFHFMRPDQKGQFTRHVTMSRTDMGWKAATKHISRNEET